MARGVGSKGIPPFTEHGFRSVGDVSYRRRSQKGRRKDDIRWRQGEGTPRFRFCLCLCMHPHALFIFLYDAMRYVSHLALQTRV